MKRFNALNLAVLAALGNPSLFVEGEPAAAPGGGSTAPDAKTDAPAPKPVKAKSKKATAKKPAAKAAKKAKKTGKSGANDGLKGPAVLKKYAPDYVKGGPKGDAKTASGNKTVDNGDKLANKLRGMELDAVYKLAVETMNAALEEGEEKVTVASLQKKYGKLNLGMQRMNLGNRMRGAMGLSKSGKTK